ERERLADREIEYLMDRAAAVPHLEQLRLEALAVALIAWNEDVGKELHLDADLALALTGLAAPPRHVEREVARGQTARARVLRRGEPLPDRLERVEVRHRIRSRRA